MYGILVLYIVQFVKTPTPFTAKLDLTQYTERNIKMGDFPAAFDDMEGYIRPMGKMCLWEYLPYLYIFWEGPQMYRN